MRMPRHLRYCQPAHVALAVALTCASATSAQNRLQNPDFDGFSSGPADFPGWDEIGVFPQAGDDADGCPVSDSYRISTNSQAAGARALDCVPVTLGDVLHLEVAYRSDTVVDMRLSEYTNSTCTVGVLTEVPDPEISASAEWTTIRIESEITFPATTAVRLWLRTDGDGAYFAEFDRAYLGFAERIFADDFDGDSGGTFCRWDAVVDGLPL